MVNKLGCQCKKKCKHGKPPLIACLSFHYSSSSKISYQIYRDVGGRGKNKSKQEQTDNMPLVIMVMVTGKCHPFDHMMFQLSNGSQVVSIGKQFLVYMYNSKRQQLCTCSYAPPLNATECYIYKCNISFRLLTVSS